VTRLLFEGTRAVGVEYLHSGMLHQVRVDREVILSAGAFDSPKLLMLSGIGDAAHLQALGFLSSSICRLSKPPRPRCRFCGIPGNSELTLATPVVSGSWIIFA